MTSRKRIIILIVVAAVCLTFVIATVLGALTVGILAASGIFSPRSDGNGYEMLCEDTPVRADAGEHIVLTVTLKNNTGETYSYEGSYSELKPEIVLVSENGEFKIEHDDMPYTNDFARHTFSHGDTRTTLFYFTVPENAPKGSYRAEMTFDNSRTVQNGVVVVR
jgi:hypothetical protein